MLGLLILLSRNPDLRLGLNRVTEVSADLTLLLIRITIRACFGCTQHTTDETWLLACDYVVFICKLCLLEEK